MNHRNNKWSKKCTIFIDKSQSSDRMLLESMHWAAVLWMEVRGEWFKLTKGYINSNNPNHAKQKLDTRRGVMIGVFTWMSRCVWCPDEVVGGALFCIFICSCQVWDKKNKHITCCINTFKHQAVLFSLSYREDWRPLETPVLTVGGTVGGTVQYIVHLTQNRKRIVRCVTLAIIQYSVTHRVSRVNSSISFN